jgi:hypothetical protein
MPSSLQIARARNGRPHGAATRPSAELAGSVCRLADRTTLDPRPRGRLEATVEDLGVEVDFAGPLDRPGFGIDANLLEDLAALAIGANTPPPKISSLRSIFFTAPSEKVK